MKFRERNFRCAGNFIAGGLQQQISGANTQYAFESKNRIAQVIEDAEEKYHIEGSKCPDIQIIYVAKEGCGFRAQSASTNIESSNRSGKRINRDDLLCTPTLRFKRKKSFGASDVKDAHPSHIFGKAEIR